MTPVLFLPQSFFAKRITPAGYSLLRSQPKDSLCRRTAWLSWIAEAGRETILTSQRAS